LREPDERSATRKRFLTPFLERTDARFRTSGNDPLGRNPNGLQLFAMQPDGSGLRQLTDARGVFRDHGALEVETVDTFLNAPYR
jgi:hypothetical protein